MSATGHGGVSIIFGENHAELKPVLLLSGQNMVFTHNLGRKAYQVLVTDAANGARVPNTVVAVTQPTANAVVLTNLNEGDTTVYTAIRWEDFTPSLDLIHSDDPRVGIR
jgi:hypothetical protein